MAGLILLGIAVTFRLFFIEMNMVKFFLSIILLSLVILFNSYYLKDLRNREVHPIIKFLIPIAGLIDTVIFYSSTEKGCFFVFIAVVYFVLINLSFFFMAKRA